MNESLHKHFIFAAFDVVKALCGSGATFIITSVLDRLIIFTSAASLCTHETEGQAVLLLYEIIVCNIYCPLCLVVEDSFRSITGEMLG